MMEYCKRENIFGKLLYPMMLYNLRNGKTIELTIEEFLYMSDDDLRMLEGMDIGETIEDPFHSSALGSETLPFLDEFEPLTNIPAAVKLLDKEVMPLD